MNNIIIQNNSKYDLIKIFKDVLCGISCKNIINEKEYKVINVACDSFLTAILTTTYIFLYCGKGRI